MTDIEQAATQHEPEPERLTWAQLPPILKGCVIQNLAEYSARLKREHNERALAFQTVVDGVAISHQEVIKNQLDQARALAPYQATIAAVDCAMRLLEAPSKPIDPNGSGDELGQLIEDAARVLARKAQSEEDYEIVQRLRSVSRK